MQHKGNNPNQVEKYEYWQTGMDIIIFLYWLKKQYLLLNGQHWFITF